MNSVSILRTPNADSRTANGDVNKILIFSDTEKHIDGVQDTMKELLRELVRRAMIHDYTKIEFFEEFYEDFNKHRKDPENIDFKSLPWWQKHLTERHHLNDKVPEDVDLLDVIEMVVDCVCAGLARSGSVRPVTIDPDILTKAVANTEKLLAKHIIVID